MNILFSRPASRLITGILLFTASQMGTSEEVIKGISIDGLLEVEAGYHKDEEGHSSSDITLGKAYLGFSAHVSDWSQARLSFLYEPGTTDLQVDEAYIQLGQSAYFIMGQRYLPFGRFESNLVSDPLTYDMSHTLLPLAQLGFANQGMLGSIYVYGNNTTNEENDTLNRYGLQLGMVKDVFELGISYLSDFGQTEGPAKAIGHLVDNHQVGGFSAYALTHLGPLNFIGEYLGAVERFQPNSLAFANQGAKPVAWNLETGYQFKIAGKETTLALAYQASQESLAIELPKRRYLGAISVELVDEHTALKLEYLYDQDYRVEEGGTGGDSETITLQLAIEF